jgi:NAD(P)-dependent dehydrogenase (short-subunit alcohol dehydrogenase family)
MGRAIKMNFEKFDLSGKTALITGAGGMLGIEHAAALLECGAKVVLTDINEIELNEARQILKQNYPSINIYTEIMDVCQLTSIYKVAENFASQNIRIDILINNAAIDPKVNREEGILEKSRLENFALGDWNLQLAVGLTGAFLCSQVFGTAMSKDHEGGVILNIASDLSVISPDQRIYRKDGLRDDIQPVKPVTYSVIKSGLIGLTRYLATYWAHKNVRCNALSPGGVFNDQGEEFVKRLTSLIPMGRMATKDEYRSAIKFLCSNASSYMNGQNIVIDGGRSIW